VAADGARGVAALRRVEAILRNPETYRLAEAIPDADHSSGGRRRDYPAFMVIVYEALISVYGSARQVEAELGHRLVWRLVQRLVKKRTGVVLPGRPMRRHHYLYLRNTYLTRPDVLAELGRIHREAAAAQALDIGLLDPDGPGSWTRPHRSRLLYGDGKVITPLYKAHAGDTRLDRTTGELRPVRYEPDGALHFEGTGETAWGTKWVLVACRSEHERGRMILDVDFVPQPGGEAAVAMGCLERTAPLTPGAQAVVYDTALRGVHHQQILRHLGLIPINRVAAAKAGAKTPRRDKAERRTEMSTVIETKTITRADGTTETITLYARAGALGIGRLTDDGEHHFDELRRTHTIRRADKAGTYRWYNEYALPDHLGGAKITVRLHGDDQDTKRKLNRTENLRPIPPSDPDFADLFRRRNDAESINRNLDDTLFLRRAHSVGHRRQLVNLLGYALMVNSLTILEHQARHGRSPDLLAA
jgi:hypothetical protein